MHSFVVTVSRFHRSDDHIYIVQGYFQGNTMGDAVLTATLDGRELPLKVSCRQSLLVRQKYFARGVGYEHIDREYDALIELPEGYENGKRLRLVQQEKDSSAVVFQTTTARLRKELRRPEGYLETFRRSGDTVAIGGWAVGNGLCRIRVYDRDGAHIPVSVTRHFRPDLLDSFPEVDATLPKKEISFGYEASFQAPESEHVRFVITAQDQQLVIPVDLRRGEKILAGSQSGLLRKTFVYLKRNGLQRTVGRVSEKVSEKLTGRRESYMSWRKRHMPGKEELTRQYEQVWDEMPLISIVVPLYRTEKRYLDALIESVLQQTYANWQLVLSDGSGSPSPLAQVLAAYADRDERITIVPADTQRRIAENTNAAIEKARGEYIVFADHDDTLSPDALYETVQAALSQDADFIYSDEDKISADGKRYFEPHFKTDYNVDLLCSMNYICHLVAVRRSLMDAAAQEAGGLYIDPAFEGAQDYDFVLRCVEKADHICHIPKVLYHWRSHAASTAENPASKTYAFTAGQRAVQAHYRRIGVRAQVLSGAYPGLYQTIYEIPEQAPLVSVIIPNKDHIDDLDKCLRSIAEKSAYPSCEILVIENNSTDEETFAYYDRIQKEDQRIRVLTWNDAFNYSAINNFGAEAARGDYYLFLNNDTAVKSADCLEQLLGPCLRSEVGAVGAKLLYEDETIQHAGVILGYGGLAGHAFQYAPGNDNGYFSRIICQSDLSAVTAACMMVKKEAFAAVGGFDPTLRVAFNDIDFCLKLREAGYLVVYNPLAVLYHYESKSRGMEDSPDKIARFNAEADLFLKRWQKILTAGDPYYNPNLSLNSNDFQLKE